MGIEFLTVDARFALMVMLLKLFYNRKLNHKEIGAVHAISGTSAGEVIVQQKLVKYIGNNPPDSIVQPKGGLMKVIALGEKLGYDLNNLLHLRDGDRLKLLADLDKGVTNPKIIVDNLEGLPIESAESHIDYVSKSVKRREHIRQNAVNKKKAKHAKGVPDAERVKSFKDVMAIYGNLNRLISHVQLTDQGQISTAKGWQNNLAVILDPAGKALSNAHYMNACCETLKNLCEWIGLECGSRPTFAPIKQTALTCVKACIACTATCYPMEILNKTDWNNAAKQIKNKDTGVNAKLKAIMEPDSDSGDETDAGTDAIDGVVDTIVAPLNWAYSMFNDTVDYTETFFSNGYEGMSTFVKSSVGAGVHHVLEPKGIMSTICLTYILSKIVRARMDQKREQIDKYEHMFEVFTQAQEKFWSEEYEQMENAERQALIFDWFLQNF